ncbi:6-phosphogluconolactonase [Chondromyces apiculatus]|uniref:6-phosphogluconolactonase n=1 Tax=Chondromyces apiculatus DSM 436 TaxID=1192034 RepID=A0A017TE51_9BACT|nr:6-phosphogluconolactonase [Chondromyces apiculatus]EYF07543.1 6-phosphogluconolactonase [Chondromyces apiculatus DSM 436]
MSKTPHGPEHEETVIAKGDDELANFGAELLARAITDAVNARGIARVALSGGSTPVPAYVKLASYDLPWDVIEWFWVDERAVPPDNARSNYGAARRALALAPVPEARFHRMEGEGSDLDAAAARYEALLRAHFGVATAVAFDAMTLGIGDDGHIASLFPRTGAVAINDRLVAAIPAERTPGHEARITLTAPVLHEARFALMIVQGAQKRAPLQAARTPGATDEVPARLASGVKGHLCWLLDQTAAVTS